MGKGSAIAWTHHTFNPWEGCEKVSAGCKNCYAEERDKRFHEAQHWGPDGKRMLHTDSYWRQPLKWDREAHAAGERHRVFCLSLGDVFEGRLELAGPRMRLGELIRRTGFLDWMLLTKRPQDAIRLAERDMGWSRDAWPSNVWFGTTVENQEELENRLEHFVHVPARIRFLSCEPLLERLSIGLLGTVPKDWGFGYRPLYDFVNLVIVGGESGKNARPFELQWPREIRDECKSAGVPFFMKQVGANALLRLRGFNTTRFETKDKAGADMAEFPSDLQVREMPGEVRS